MLVRLSQGAKTTDWVAFLTNTLVDEFVMHLRYFQHAQVPGLRLPTVSLPCVVMVTTVFVAGGGHGGRSKWMRSTRRAALSTAL